MSNYYYYCYVQNWLKSKLLEVQILKFEKETDMGTMIKY